MQGLNAGRKSHITFSAIEGHIQILFGRKLHWACVRNKVFLSHAAGLFEGGVVIIFGRISYIE